MIYNFEYSTILNAELFARTDHGQNIDSIKFEHELQFRFPRRSANFSLKKN